jgi:hypothetical protein
MTTKIIGYFHICQLGEWKRSFDMIYNCIQNSGLYEITREIRIGILTDSGIISYDDRFKDPKIKIICTGKSEEYERPTLTHMRAFSEIDGLNTKYWYLHTKGLRHFGTPKESYVIDWIKLMLYWNVIKWKLAILKLDNFDTYGCNELDRKIYSGNFWWANAGHIRQLPIKINDHYTGPEEWILTKSDRMLNIFSSGIQGDGHYLKNYSCDKYYLPEDKYLIQLPLDFNVYDYRELNPDLQNMSTMDSISHYLNSGKKENRNYKKSGKKNYETFPLDFDYIFYRYNYDDLNNLTNEELKLHWLKYGKKEGRKYRGTYTIPPDFDFNYYRSIHKELKNKSNKELLIHWNTEGKYTNKFYKDPSKKKNLILPCDFDIEYYRNNYSDTKNLSDEKIIEHWFLIGKSENRNYKDKEKLPKDFNPKIYRDLYKDLSKLNDEEIKIHWIKNGQYEGRKYK